MKFFSFLATILPALVLQAVPTVNAQCGNDWVKAVDEAGQTKTCYESDENISVSFDNNDRRSRFDWIAVFPVRANTETCQDKKRRYWPQGNWPWLYLKRTEASPLPGAFFKWYEYPNILDGGPGIDYKIYMFANNGYFVTAESETFRLGNCVAPTSAPTAAPTTPAPTAAPTFAPTSAPVTSAPTSAPVTSAPTVAPTSAPTSAPVTAAPTVTPTSSPTSAPVTSAPTSAPVTAAPTVTPTSSPTSAPTVPPTSAPTSAPVTSAPTVPPTSAPTSAPVTSAPTVAPTSSPTSAPTAAPTSAPTASCTSSLESEEECYFPQQNSFVRFQFQSCGFQSFRSTTLNDRVAVYPDKGSRVGTDSASAFPKYPIFFLPLLQEANEGFRLAMGLGHFGPYYGQPLRAYLFEGRGAGGSGWLVKAESEVFTVRNSAAACSVASCQDTDVSGSFPVVLNRRTGKVRNKNCNWLRTGNLRKKCNKKIDGGSTDKVFDRCPQKCAFSGLGPCAP